MSNINKIIGKFIGKLHTRSVLIDECEISDETDIANSFNNYFTEIGSKLNSEIPTTDISLLRNMPTISSSRSFFLISSG